MRLELYPEAVEPRPAPLGEKVRLIGFSVHGIDHVVIADGSHVQGLPLLIEGAPGTDWAEVFKGAKLVDLDRSVVCDCHLVAEATAFRRDRDMKGVFLYPLEDSTLVDAIDASKRVRGDENYSDGRIRLGKVPKIRGVPVDSVYFIAVDSVARRGQVLSLTEFQASAHDTLLGLAWLPTSYSDPEVQTGVKWRDLALEHITRVRTFGHWIPLRDSVEMGTRILMPFAVYTAAFEVRKLADLTENEITEEDWGFFERQSRYSGRQLADVSRIAAMMACRGAGGRESAVFRPGGTYELSFEVPKGPQGVYRIRTYRRNGLLGAIIGTGLVLAFLVYSTS